MTNLCSDQVQKCARISPRPMNHLVDQRDWKTHDVRIRPDDSCNESRSESLNCIRSCFVERLTSFGVPLDLLLGQRGKLDGGRRDARINRPIRRDEDNSRDHLVRSARQQPQHALRVLGAVRLAEDVMVDDDGRIGGQNGRVGQVRTDCVGFRFRDTHHVGFRRFTVMKRFIDIGGAHEELDAGRAQQLGPSRRRRREDNPIGGDETEHSADRATIKR